MVSEQQQTIDTLLTWLQILPHIYSMFIRFQPAVQQWVQLVIIIVANTFSTWNRKGQTTLLTDNDPPIVLVLSLVKDNNSSIVCYEQCVFYLV